MDRRWTVSEIGGWPCDRCALVGMVHLAPLPGSPGWAGSMSDVLRRALADADALIDGGCDALLVENMGDVPYLRGRVEPETVAAVAVAAEAVVAAAAPVGVQLLAGANREALGAAVAAGARSCAVEAFAWAHVADEGWIDACAGRAAARAAALGVDVEVWADVQKKHAAHAVTADLSLEDLARGPRSAGRTRWSSPGRRPARRPTRPTSRQARAAGLPVVGRLRGHAAGRARARRRARPGADRRERGSRSGGDWRNPVDPDPRPRARAGPARGPGRGRRRRSGSAAPLRRRFRVDTRPRGPRAPGRREATPWVTTRRPTGSQRSGPTHGAGAEGSTAQRPRGVIARLAEAPRGDRGRVGRWRAPLAPRG
jgi:hypothetical protein